MGEVGEGERCWVRRRPRVNYASVALGAPLREGGVSDVLGAGEDGKERERLASRWGTRRGE